MAKRSKIKSGKKSSLKFLSLPFIAGVIVVLVVFGILSTKMNGQDVKGTATFKPPVRINSDNASESAKKCKARVTSFTIEGICTTNTDRNKFTSARYSCADGTSGIIQKDCFTPEDAFARAMMACVKTACPRPSNLPKTSPSGFPIRTLPPTTK